jgi:protein-disulfide isomerase
MTQLCVISRRLVPVRLLALAFCLAAVPALAGANRAGLGEMSIGAEDAPITMIEYASMTCPHCAVFHADTFEALKTKYIDTGKVRLVFREYPLDRLAFFASKLARCAGADGFFPMLEVLFKQQQNWARSKDPEGALARIGRLAGIDQESFDACMNDEAITKVVLENRMTGETKHKISSTPSFVVNGQIIAGGRTIENFDIIFAPYLK